MIATIQDFFGASSKYIELFDLFVAKHNLVGRAAPDHVCYDCSSTESFERTRKMLEPECVFLYQAYVSGRRIAYIKFKKGIQTSLGVIKFLELSDQKPDNTQTEKFDHIEVYAVGRTCEDMVAELQKTETVIASVKPHHTTHDVDMGSGFRFRCTKEPLIEKIKASEMC